MSKEDEMNLGCIAEVLQYYVVNRSIYESSEYYRVNMIDSGSHLQALSLPILSSQVILASFVLTF